MTGDPQACMAGIVFAKFMMPINRGETIMFSRIGVITMRFLANGLQIYLWLIYWNGVMYLLIRLADLRAKHLIECHINGHFLTKVVSAGTAPSCRW